ncbi:sedoheptulose 7-phosphate cyclase [Chondromyces apiculatus]|uniref:3-dehydroquinate synthase n=1 Tax=Chondromyces apiculatus DSM 436 TaxID=1192034 RepID=A0A017SW78_9BACT|nr:sedoheptulose 7-phosphate cyclase [Chondromyces apiculatus]EYF01007.1 3-dehydroquinate synthase [Chondromyces apiculatus DSM 436]
MNTTQEQLTDIHTMRCTSKRSYDVQIAHRVLDPDNDALARRIGGRRALVVTTPSVARLHGEALQGYLARHAPDTDVVTLECSEDHKSLRLVARLCHEAQQRGLDRKAVLVGLGGGVCTDVVSVAASAIRRGVACIRVPTTLIGQIDAGIGVKGAVNFAGKKSFFGCFYPPEAVLIDPAFLATLPQAFLRYGLAEIVKMALVRDRELFELVEAHHSALLRSNFAEPPHEGERVIWLSAKRMLEELQTNPYEDQTYQRLVDLGHTFSPLLEAACDFTMHHGQAVAIDLALTVTLAEALGVLSGAERDRVVRLLRQSGLPTTSRLLTSELCREALREAARHRGSALNLVLPVAIGKASFLERVEDLPPEALDAAVARLAQEAAAEIAEGWS